MKKRLTIENLAVADVRVWRKLGIFAPGDVTNYYVRYPDIKLVADLTSEGEPTVLVVTADRTWVIKLMTKPTRFGGLRYFLVDEAGKPRDVLYFSEEHGRYVSRGAAKLRYASQKANAADRFFANRDKVVEKLKSVRGPGARERKRLLEEQLERYRKAGDRVGFGVARRSINRDHDIADRQHFSRQRLRAAKQAMQSRKTMSPAKVLAAFRGEFQLATSKLKPPPEVHDVPNEPTTKKQPLMDGVLDILILRKLIYVVPGKLTGFELGWPIKWLGNSKRRIFVLVDLRKTGKNCAVIFIKDGSQRPQSQLFWIGAVKAGFGRRELRFIDYKTRIRTRRLIYRRGRFVLPDVSDDVPADPQAEKREKILRKMARVMKRPGFNAPSPLAHIQLQIDQEQDIRERMEAAALPPMAGGPDEPRIIEKYQHLVDGLKATALVPEQPYTRDHTQAGTKNVAASVAIDDLAIRNYLQRGAMTAGEFDWTNESIGKVDRRLYLLVDVRGENTPCIVFVMQDAYKKPKAQLFWLWFAQNAHGRRQLRFQDPVTGDLSAQLYYRRGKFRLPGRPTATPELKTEVPVHAEEVKPPSTNLERLRALRRPRDQRG